MVYEISPSRFIGNQATIVKRDAKGQVTPAINIFRGTAAFAGDVQKLAENVVSILNDNEPANRLNGGKNQLFWSRQPDGFSLRQKPQGQGTSITSLIFNVPASAEAATRTEILSRFQDGFVQKALIGTIATSTDSAPIPRAPSFGNK